MPLHYVDPHNEHDRRYRGLEGFGRSRPGQFLSRRVFFRIDPWLYRATGGRYPQILGGPATAPLTSTGAKSDQPRVRQLTYFHDGPDVILLASNSAKPNHPGWYYNLKAHPECQLGDEKFIAKEVTDPDDYARLYTLAEHVYTGYRDYRVKTAHIPAAATSGDRRQPQCSLRTSPADEVTVLPCKRVSPNSVVPQQRSFYS